MKEQAFKYLVFLLIGIACGFSVDKAPTNTVVVMDRNEVIRELLIDEVDGYINKNFSNSNLDAQALVDICLEEDFDIAFALAQGQIESGFGTAGAARKTNSVWNVGHYDNRTANCVIRAGLGFNHPNESIEPYIRLVKDKYLGDNKTVEDLMKRYVSLSGYRYASDKSYESKLRATYQTILRETNINTLANRLS